MNSPTRTDADTQSSSINIIHEYRGLSSLRVSVHASRRDLVLSHSSSVRHIFYSSSSYRREIWDHGGDRSTWPPPAGGHTSLTKVLSSSPVRQPAQHPSCCFFLRPRLVD